MATVEEQLIQKGREQGLEQGRALALRETLQRLLRACFGAPDPATEKRIADASAAARSGGEKIRVTAHRDHVTMRIEVHPQGRGPIRRRIFARIEGRLNSFELHPAVDGIAEGG